MRCVHLTLGREAERPTWVLPLANVHSGWWAGSMPQVPPWKSWWTTMNHWESKALFIVVIVHSISLVDQLRQGLLVTILIVFLANGIERKFNRWIMMSSWSKIHSHPQLHIAVMMCRVWQKMWQNQTTIIRDIPWQYFHTYYSKYPQTTPKIHSFISSFGQFWVPLGSWLIDGGVQLIAMSLPDLCREHVVVDLALVVAG